MKKILGLVTVLIVTACISAKSTEKRFNKELYSQSMYLIEKCMRDTVFRYEPTEHSLILCWWTKERDNKVGITFFFFDTWYLAHLTHNTIETKDMFTVRKSYYQETPVFFLSNLDEHLNFPILEDYMRNNNDDLYVKLYETEPKFFFGFNPILHGMFLNEKEIYHRRPYGN